MKREMKLKTKITRRRLLKITAAVAGSGVGVGLYAWRWEPQWLEVVWRDLRVANLPPQLEGARLAHLSDLHIGTRVDDSYLIHTFKRVKEYAPDIVVYTGDFTDYHRNIYNHAKRIFSYLPVGARGTFAVLGNHDYGPSWACSGVADKIAGLAGKAGLHILRNQSAEVEGLQVAGLDDLWACRFEPKRVLPGLDPDAASIVLSHNPDSVDRSGWEGYTGWILAGHTHGGQCKPPFLPPPLLPVQNRRYTSGEFALSGNRRMYINRGVGHITRVRFNARPEVTLFKLKRA